MVEDEFLGCPIQSRGDDRKARTEFREDLAAGAARADWDIRFCNNGHTAKVPVPGRQSHAHGYALGTHRQPEAEILDIASSENRAVAAFDGRTDRET